MSDASPDRLKKIFAEVLKTSPPERERFLAETYEGHSELRREVESLLRAHENAGDFLCETAPMVGTGIRASPALLCPAVH
jgi:hypothetical protein